MSAYRSYGIGRFVISKEDFGHRDRIDAAADETPGDVPFGDDEIREGQFEGSNEISVGEIEVAVCQAGEFVGVYRVHPPSLFRNC